MTFNNDDPLRWQLHTKVDKDTHDMVYELSMQFAGGNISLWLREAIRLAIDSQIDKSNSAKVRLKHLKKVRLEKSEMEAEFLTEYNEYLFNPTPKAEKILKDTAIELGIAYPPQFTLFDIPEYQKIINILESSDGEVTFRTLQRKLNFSKNELEIKIKRLEDEEIIGLEYEGKSVTVYLIDYREGKKLLDSIT